MERPAPITVTDAAVTRAAHLIGAADHPVAGIRVGIETKGCSGFAYKVEYADEQGKFEDVVEQNGVKFFIDPMAVMYLLGSELDYQESKMESVISRDCCGGPLSLARQLRAHRVGDPSYWLGPV
ncbi:MAG: iron-sulfur cluster assembly accessory protein [Alphaproteobacteria bacterium]|nr:iron-sulfur cluster assembly accessory protein [Alphaproteobacteria bacterium]